MYLLTYSCILVKKAKISLQHTYTYVSTKHTHTHTYQRNRQTERVGRLVGKGQRERERERTDRRESCHWGLNTQQTSSLAATALTCSWFARSWRGTWSQTCRTCSAHKQSAVWAAAADPPAHSPQKYVTAKAVHTGLCVSLIFRSVLMKMHCKSLQIACRLNQVAALTKDLQKWSGLKKGALFGQGFIYKHVKMNRTVPPNWF